VDTEILGLLKTIRRDDPANTNTEKLKSSVESINIPDILLDRANLTKLSTEQLQKLFRQVKVEIETRKMLEVVDA
jgi:hypothetical protein